MLLKTQIMMNISGLIGYNLQIALYNNKMYCSMPHIQNYIIYILHIVLYDRAKSQNYNIFLAISTAEEK